MRRQVPIDSRLEPSRCDHQPPSLINGFQGSGQELENRQALLLLPPRVRGAAPRFIEAGYANLLPMMWWTLLQVPVVVKGGLSSRFMRRSIAGMV